MILLFSVYITGRSENELAVLFCSFFKNLPPRHNMVSTSLVPRFEEEEKGPGFSHSRMRLITVEFDRLCILLTYFRTLVTSISILNVTLFVDLIATYGACKELT